MCGSNPRPPFNVMIHQRGVQARARAKESEEKLKKENPAQAKLKEKQEALLKVGVERRGDEGAGSRWQG